MPAIRSLPFVLLSALLLAVLQACARAPDDAARADVPTALGADLVGSWRAQLASPGGALPFGLRIAAGPAGLEAVMANGGEEAPASGVEVSGNEVAIRFDFYDSEITARFEDDGRLRGAWRRTSEGGVDSVLAFLAERGDTERFRPLGAAETSSADGRLDRIEGVWAATFVDEDGSEPAQGELRQDGERVLGTFLTPTGDYRFLEGRFEQGMLRLSTFDGAHAFLFHARVQDDGTLAGDFWSRDTYHASWTARPAVEGERVLPDPWSLSHVTADDQRFRFAFPDLDGATVSASDPRFAGKVVLVNIFGSWCPNCNDKAPLLAEWNRRYGPRGLAIVGLAYEFTGDRERDRRQVRRFAERHGIDYPLLLAGGTSDKAAAAATLPDLDRIVAYPTSIFIGRDGRVRKVHSGFAGPGTGDHHRELVGELEGLIAGLLDEPPPAI